MMLSDDELDRYARQIILPQIGGVGQARLKAARVAVVGAGAIGSAVIPALAAAGVGRLTIIDHDQVERSNLQRQLIYRDDQYGLSKAEAAAAFACALNPKIIADPKGVRIDRDNAPKLLHDHDLVVDGTDNFATRLIVNQACVDQEVPLLSAAAAQFQVQVALFRGWERKQPCYRCFVGDAFDSDDCDTCAEQGILGATAGIAGHLASLLALRTLAGAAAQFAGKLFLFDGIQLQMRALNIPEDASCRTCGGKYAAGT